MNIEIKKNQQIGIGIGLVIIAISFLFRDSTYFALILGGGVIVIALPFVLSTITETRIASEKEEMFLEFSRNLVESVKMGSPISKSIIILKDRDYGVLSPHIKKLANQIYMGIPLNSALQTFSKDIRDKKISRAIALIRQAERAGGNIGEILESVAEAVSMADKLKKERKAAISTLMVQGYIIFFVFMIIVLVMQFQILPMISGIAGLTSVQGATTAGAGLEESEIANSFMNLLLIQGLFSGLIIGKLAEGNIKNGVKHSFILMLSAFLISTVANAVFGG